MWAKSVFLIMGKKFRVFGKENIIKGERYILVANHASLFDIVAITSFYPGISWFGHERLLKVPVFNHLLKIMDYVPFKDCLLYTSPSPRDRTRSRMPSSA